ncbi:hypothetical protein C0J52_03120 [Blattella germanica]|nr:hypothetical protein C0J52_03120 [Blattella germanica]
MTFPIRGHSYLECDRDMALINQKCKAEVPEDWIEEIKNARQKPTAFQVVEVDQAVIRNWPGFLSTKFVKNCPFPSRPIREMIVSSEHSRVIKHRSTYNGYWETSVIQPRGFIQQAAYRSGEFFLPEKLHTFMLSP